MRTIMLQIFCFYTIIGKTKYAKYQIKYTFLFVLNFVINFNSFKFSLNVLICVFLAMNFQNIE